MLKDDYLEQERARLNALRERDEDRTKRFMNAKNRSIGIDKKYLDKQIEEKRLLELAHQEEKLAEGEDDSWCCAFIPSLHRFIYDSPHCEWFLKLKI